MSASLNSKHFSSHPIQHSKLKPNSSHPITGHISREHDGNLAWFTQYKTLEIVDVYSKSVIATLEFPHAIQSTCVLTHNFELYHQSSPIRHFLTVLHGTCNVSLIDFSTLQIAHHFSFQNLLPNESLLLCYPLFSYHQFELAQSISNTEEMEFQTKLFGFMNFPLLLGTNKGSLYIMDTLTSHHNTTIPLTSDVSILSTTMGYRIYSMLAEDCAVSCIKSDWNTKCIALGFTNGAVLLFSFVNSATISQISSMDSVKELENQTSAVTQFVFHTGAQEVYLWMYTVNHQLSCVQISLQTHQLQCIITSDTLAPLLHSFQYLQCVSICDLHAASVYTNDNNLDKSITVRNYLICFDTKKLIRIELGPILFKGFSMNHVKEITLPTTSHSLTWLDGWIDEKSIGMMEEQSLFFSLIGLTCDVQLVKYDYSLETIHEEEEELYQVMQQCQKSENWHPITNLLLAKKTTMNMEQIDVFTNTNVIWKFIMEQSSILKMNIQSKLVSILSLGSMEVSYRTKLLQEIAVTHRQLQQLNSIVSILQEKRVKKEEEIVTLQQVLFYLKMMEWFISNGFVPHSTFKDCFAKENLKNVWKQRRNQMQQEQGCLIDLFLGNDMTYPIASMSQWISLLTNEQLMIAPHRLIIVWYYFLLDCRMQFPILIPSHLLTSFAKHFLISKAMERCIIGIHQLDTLTTTTSTSMEWQQACSFICSSVNTYPFPLTIDRICQQLLVREQYHLAYQVAHQMELKDEQLMIHICVKQGQWSEALQWARKTTPPGNKIMYKCLFDHVTHDNQTWLSLLTKEEEEQVWYPYVVENGKWLLLFQYWLSFPQQYAFAMELYSVLEEKNMVRTQLRKVMSSVKKVYENSVLNLGSENLHPILSHSLQQTQIEKEKLNSRKMIDKAKAMKPVSATSMEEIEVSTASMEEAEDDDAILDENLLSNGFEHADALEVEDE